jgi:hypothetical protein
MITIIMIQIKIPQTLPLITINQITIYSKNHLANFLLKKNYYLKITCSFFALLHETIKQLK